MLKRVKIKKKENNVKQQVSQTVKPINFSEQFEEYFIPSKLFHKVYIGDAEVVLKKKIENESIDTLFTSPPYYVARETEYWSSYDDYLEKMKRIFKEVYRVIKTGRVIGVNVADYAYEGKHYPLGADFTNILVNELKFNYLMTVIWRKPEGISSTFGQFAGNFIKWRNPLYFIPNQNFEYIILVRKGKSENIEGIENEKKKFKYKVSFIEKDLRPFLQAVWDVNPKSTNRYHPLEFPEKLVEVYLNLFSVPGDVVLDIFAGSGSTGAVCWKLHRSSVQIELRPEYIEIIKKRLNWGRRKTFSAFKVNIEYYEEIVEI